MDKLSLDSMLMLPFGIPEIMLGTNVSDSDALVLAIEFGVAKNLVDEEFGKALIRIVTNDGGG